MSIWSDLIARAQAAANPAPASMPRPGAPNGVVSVPMDPSDPKTPLLPMPTVAPVQRFNPQPMPNIPYMPGVRVGPQDFRSYQPAWMSQLPPLQGGAPGKGGGQPAQPGQPGPQLPPPGSQPGTNPNAPGPGSGINVPPPTGPAPVAPYRGPLLNTQTAPLTVRGTPTYVQAQQPKVPFSQTRVGSQLRATGKQLLMNQGLMNLGLPF